MGRQRRGIGSHWRRRAGVRAIWLGLVSVLLFQLRLIIPRDGWVLCTCPSPECGSSSFTITITLHARQDVPSRRILTFGLPAVHPLCYQDSHISPMQVAHSQHNYCRRPLLSPFCRHRSHIRLPPSCSNRTDQVEFSSQATSCKAVADSIQPAEHRLAVSQSASSSSACTST